MNFLLGRCYGLDICIEIFLVKCLELVMFFIMGNNFWNLIDYEEKRSYGLGCKEDVF